VTESHGCSSRTSLSLDRADVTSTVWQFLEEQRPEGLFFCMNAALTIVESHAWMRARGLDAGCSVQTLLGPRLTETAEASSVRAFDRARTDPG
jgi:hypothetical protein